MSLSIEDQIKAWRKHPHYRKRCADCGHSSALHNDGVGKCVAYSGSHPPGCPCTKFLLISPENPPNPEWFPILATVYMARAVGKKSGTVNETGAARKPPPEAKQKKRR